MNRPELSDGFLRAQKFSARTENVVPERQSGWIEAVIVLPEGQLPLCRLSCRQDNSCWQDWSRSHIHNVGT